MVCRLNMSHSGQASEQKAGPLPAGGMETPPPKSWAVPGELGERGRGSDSLYLDHLYTHRTLTPKSIPHSDLHLDSVSTWVLFSLGSPAPWTDVPPQQLESFKHGVMLGPLMGLGGCSKAGAL